MLNIIGNVIGALKGNSYTAEYQAVLDYASVNGITAPPSALNLVYDQFIKDLKAADLWDTLLTANIYRYGSVEFGTINLKNPATYRHEVLGGSAVVFTPNSGVKSNAVGGYINTKFKTNEYSGIETTLTVSRSVSESSTVFGSFSTDGANILTGSTASRSALQPLISSSTGGVYRYGSSSTFPNTNVQGHYVGTYNGVNRVLYKNGVKTVGALGATAPTLTLDVLMLARNNATVDNTITVAERFPYDMDHLFRWNKQFTDADELALRTACTAFQTNGSLFFLDSFDYTLDFTLTT